MDPVSQGVLGASLPQSVSSHNRIRTVTWVGCLAGMAPDLDVLIWSPTDPMLLLEYHRQFTHALAFIPFGALLCALLFFRFARPALDFKQTYLVCFLGYGTHGLLDACTTYGTQLLWPFSDDRIAWNNVSVVDPAFTLPVMGLVALAAFRQKPLFARMAFAWAIAYLLFGVIQRERAEAAGYEIARAHGHTPLRLEAAPAFGTLLLWKIIYETEQEYHVDAVRVVFDTKTFPGSSARKLMVARDLPWLDPASQQARDLERFDWFSNHYLAIDNGNKHFIIDIRYSLIPNQVDPLWGIRLDPHAGSTQHVEYITDRNGAAGRISLLGRMLIE
jgi:inner membrane protein